jgi:hypothetical protein
MAELPKVWHRVLQPSDSVSRLPDALSQVPAASYQGTGDRIDVVLGVRQHHDEMASLGKQRAMVVYSKTAPVRSSAQWSRPAAQYWPVLSGAQSTTTLPPPKVTPDAIESGNRSSH